jgi:signal recognition particle subunit SRP54
MGDVLSLVEEVERKVDQDKAQKLAEKVVSGKRFDFNDFRDQLIQLGNMGGLAGILDKLPIHLGGKLDMAQVKKNIDERKVKRMIAIIDSMTPKERRNPQILNGSRKQRIARGSGTQPAEVNQLVNQYTEMEKMLRKMAGGGVKGLLRNFQRRLPPGRPMR